jgi:hypothetical protein
MSRIPNTASKISSAKQTLFQFLNRIYLVGKDFPLLVQRSAFASCSGEHDAKMRRLNLLPQDP